MSTVQEWFEQVWPQAVRGLGRGTSTASVEHTVKLSRPFVVRFGRWQLETLVEHAVECAGWAQAHPSNARYARTILADAVLLGVLPTSPLAQVRVRHPAPTGRGSFFPTREEIDALAVAGERFGLREWVLAGAWSGARLSALAALGARDVEPAGAVLRLQLQRKGRPGKYPAVLLQPGADALAMVLPATGRVFKRPKGGPWTVQSISAAWVKMRREIGLPEACTSHSTRRFFATHLIDQGMSEMDVALALDHVNADGHPNVDLVRRIYTRPDRAAALDRIAAIA